MLVGGLGVTGSTSFGASGEGGIYMYIVYMYALYIHIYIYMLCLHIIYYHIRELDRDGGSPSSLCCATCAGRAEVYDYYYYHYHYHYYYYCYY